MYMLDNIKKYRIILASASPRRSELLKAMGIDFETIALSVDEEVVGDPDISKIACELALRKANALPADEWTSDILLITADTIVVRNNVIMGKPADRAEAIQMLTDLSGKQHQVITGICVKSLEKQVLECAVTNVTFANLSAEEIEYYIDNYLPFDKAGAYGIQEWIGFVGVERIEGSYFNVVGLPTRKLYSILKEF